LSPELEFVRRETERTTGAASAEALSHAPEGKWSAVQVLEHLALSYSATTKGLLRATQSGQIERGGRTLKQQMRSIYVLGLGIFPAGVEAPKHTVPGAGLGDDPLRRFNDALVAMDSMLVDSEKRFGKSARLLHHPVLGPLTAQQWRRFHEVHGRHHLKQIAARLNRHA
jgi:DinB superfamily